MSKPTCRRAHRSRLRCVVIGYAAEFHGRLRVMTKTTTATGAWHTRNETSVGAGHVVDVDDQGDAAGGHSARCSCGWVSDSLWSRRRAAEAGQGHHRSL